MYSDTIQTAPPPRTRHDAQTELDRLETLAQRMDALFRVPLTNIRIGLDTLLGLVPGLGDTATAIPAGYIIWRARQMGAPAPLLWRMGMNAGIDWVIGSIPLVGDLFDLGFKANLRNVSLLRRHVERREGPRDTRRDP